MSNQNSIESTVSELLALPSFIPPLLPEVSLSILRHMTRKDLDFQEMASIVLRDPMLAARVMRVANSPFYGNQEVKGVFDALIRIGARTVKNVALEYGLNAIEVPDLRYQNAIRRVVDHCVITAKLTRLVGDVSGVKDNGLYTYGLIHDLGMVAAISTLSEIDPRPALSAENWGAIDRLNGRSFQVLLDAWGLPPSIGVVLSQLHSKQTSDPVSCVLLLSSHLAGLCGTPALEVFGVDELDTTHFEKCCETLGIETSLWDTIVLTARERGRE